MTNLEFAERLRVWADLYEKHPNLEQGYGMTLYLNSKESVARTIRMVGGKWRKSESGSASYETLTFTHFPSGLQINVPRDKVCRRIVSYDCESIMSPEEEAELLTEA